MTAKKPTMAKDPAGLDQIILAACQGGARYLEGIASAKLGRPVNIWDGVDGLGAVLQEHIAAAGVPNKRLPELLTPRAIVREIAPRRQRRKVAR